MAIEYGAYSGRARFGIDVWHEGDPNSGAVTVQWRVYLQTDRGATPGYQGNYTLVRTGTGPTGSGSVAVYTVAQTPQLLWSGSQSVSTTYGATVSRSLGVYFTSALFDGSAPSHTRGITIPARAPGAPSPATSATATYVSDTRIDVAWVRPANAGDAATIWSNVVVDRQAASTGGWSRIAVLPGTATSYADTSVVANDDYYYAVYGTNSTAWSAVAHPASTVSTTPAAPSAVAAAKDASANIVVTWQDNSVAETGFEVQDETTEVGTPAAPPFTHTTPNPAATHRYRVRAVAAGPRYSAWSAYSNTVQLQAAPAAPTNLAPNGTTWPLEDTLTLSWSHNPVDTTPQTAYELDHRLVGAGSWTTLTGTTASSRVVTGYASQADVEWRVRTKGAHADWSPYSAVATFTLSPRPTATLSAPGADVTTPSVTVAWTFFHAGGHAQTGWQVQIVQGALLVAAASGTGATATWTSGNILANDADYTVRVRVQESSGLWSTWVEQPIAVDFPPPAESMVTAAWQDGIGNVLVTAQAVTEAGKPATTSHDIARSLDGGNTWEVVALNLGTNASFLDWTSPAAGSFLYRVTAHSALPSMVHTLVTVTVPATRGNCLVWISGGPGFSQVCKVAFSPEVGFTGGRTRTLNDFDGRTLPVETSARQAPRTLSVSGSLLPDTYGQTLNGLTGSTREELEELFDIPGPHLYRDPLGRVMYGTLSPLSWSREPGGKGGVSFSITRSQRPTSAQADSMEGYYAPRIVEVAPGVYEVVGGDVIEASPGLFQEIG